MTIDSQIFAVIALISGAIGGALMLRAKVSEIAKTLEAHITADLGQQSSMVDRLARIETKINILLEGREQP